MRSGGCDMASFPQLDDITADWLADVLGAPRGLFLRSTSVGAGQVARCLKLELLDGETVVTSSVAKGPSSDPTSRATAAAQRLYLRETSFYRDHASQIGTPTPTCYFVDRNDDDDFLIVLEDMSPMSDVDQFGGLTLNQAQAGLSALAELHGPTRGDAALHGANWLGGTATELAPLYQAVLPGLFTAFLERYDDVLTESVRSTVTRLGARLSDFSGYTSPYACVVHGDFRTDNLLFGARGGVVPLAVVDWQTVSVSSPLLDVAYFITTSLDDETCARLDATLLEFYLAEMERLGAPLNGEQARSEFARYTLQPVVMLVSAAVIVERTERGDKMFLEMIRRATIAVERWGAFEELDRHVAA